MHIELNQVEIERYLRQTLAPSFERGAMSAGGSIVLEWSGDPTKNTLQLKAKSPDEAAQSR